jgi:hypothetical protein
MRLVVSIGALALSLSCVSMGAQNKALTEKQKIEALIKSVENLKDAKFIRNGAAYDAATAARFLHSKWESNAKDVKTADDFIEKIGTSSGTTGKPYLMRMKDGKETKSRDYFRAELKKLEGK